VRLDLCDDPGRLNGIPYHPVSDPRCHVCSGILGWKFFFSSFVLVLTMRLPRHDSHGFGATGCAVLSVCGDEADAQHSAA
jgi:hypothetical protein